jgi:hypothetical protein
MKITLAFDIERSGATNKYDTIAIGASVLNEEFKELDSLLLLGYVENKTQFEPRCWTEFWSENTNMLNTLKYTGELKYVDRQKEMIEQFQAFRSKWELFCKENDHELLLVSDNCVYDGGFINNMIYQYLPDTLPIPYSASDQTYESFHGTDCVLRGILKIIDPTYKSEWGFTKRIEELFELPEKRVTHDHNPANDAYCIAFDYQVSNAISNGKIKLR